MNKVIFFIALFPFSNTFAKNILESLNIDFNTLDYENNTIKYCKSYRIVGIDTQNNISSYISADISIKDNMMYLKKIKGIPKNLEGEFQFLPYPQATRGEEFENFNQTRNSKYQKFLNKNETKKFIKKVCNDPISVGDFFYIKYLFNSNNPKTHYSRYLSMVDENEIGKYDGDYILKYGWNNINKAFHFTIGYKGNKKNKISLINTQYKKTKIIDGNNPKDENGNIRLIETPKSYFFDCEGKTDWCFTSARTEKPSDLIPGLVDTEIEKYQLRVQEIK